MMWLPGFFGAFLPGWIFNVAAIFHGEEAFLAVVFLFTVHFFNNHFRPDKFPVEVVMFTGTISLEEFKHGSRRRIPAPAGQRRAGEAIWSIRPRRSS